MEKSVPEEDERTSLDEFVTHLVWMIDSMRRHGIDIMASPEFAGGPWLIGREHVRGELRKRAGKIDPRVQTGAGRIERAVDDAVQTIAGHGKPDGTGARYARAFIRRVAQDAERYISRQNALTREEAILAVLNNRGHASLVNRGDAWFPAYDQIAAIDAAGKMREHRQKPDVKMRETPPRKRQARRR